jgi:hypothetical protein
MERKVIVGHENVKHFLKGGPERERVSYDLK